jgi:hypothetical protein
MKRLASRSAGFTLVELMVSMLGGLFVSMSVFAIAKHSSGFSMEQSRISDATLQNVVGFERLKADISRAGFLSSPNVVKDPALCRSATYPAQLRQLASVFIEDVPAAQLSSESTVNGLSPKRIVLAGSYASQDLFFARDIAAGSPVTIYLQPNTLGKANLGATSAAGVNATALSNVFAANQALRVVDETGHVQFAQIAATTGGTNPSIQLSATPALQFRSGSGIGCGIMGHGEGDAVNVVNIVRYDFRDLNNPATYPTLTPMFRGGPTYESSRRELIRERLDVSGNVVANSLEIVAEYVVDLGFSLFVAPDTTSKLSRISGSNVPNYAGNPAVTPAGQGPQQIRAIQAWLSTRSQEADRNTALTLTPTAPGPSLLRISVHPTDGTKGPFARVRTLQSTITLNNQARATWR